MGDDNGQPGTGTIDAGREDTRDTQLADDAFFRALAAESRRRLLVYLLEQERTTLDELASMLVGWETAEEGGMGTTGAYEQTHLALRHQHLPMLDEVGLVDYDSESGVVSLGHVSDDAAELLRKSVVRTDD